MIKHIEKEEYLDRSSLISSCAGRRILSYLDAYGMKYDFCRFYTDEHGGVILLVNATMLLYGDRFEKEELESFVHLYRPFRIEGSQQGIELISGTEGYRHLHRNVFRLTPHEGELIDDEEVDMEPSLDDIYAILAEGFPNLLDYPMWLADTSHRIRHGISLVMCYQKTTTASIVYDINDHVLVGQVATKTASRGKGNARRLLKWLADKLQKDGKTAYLYALDTRESFYREIGFELSDCEYVLERIDEKNESAVKGTLTVND